jgi:hypothetical protein
VVNLQTRNKTWNTSERRKGAAAPKRVVALGGSHMPNSSSNIEIVVERRRVGCAASTLRDVWEVLEEKSFVNCTGIVLFGTMWENVRSENAQRARRTVSQVCIPSAGCVDPVALADAGNGDRHKNNRGAFGTSSRSTGISAWPWTRADNIRAIGDADSGLCGSARLCILRCWRVEAVGPSSGGV